MILVGLIFFISCNETNHKATKNVEKSEDRLVEPMDSDSTLKEKLELLGVKDQTLRKVLPDVTTKFGNGSAEEDYFWSLIHEQDSINEKETVRILEKYGWLSKSRIGEEANQSLWLVIQHAPLEIQEKYLPLLRESVAKNESEGWHLAFLEDRILMRNNKDQIYGSQANWDNKLGKMKIHPIEDVENVNKRRAALGLEPIEEFVEQNGYIFDQKINTDD